MGKQKLKFNITQESLRMGFYLLGPFLICPDHQLHQARASSYRLILKVYISSQAPSCRPYKIHLFFCQDAALCSWRQTVYSLNNLPFLPTEWSGLVVSSSLMLIFLVFFCNILCYKVYSVMSMLHKQNFAIVCLV